MIGTEGEIVFPDPQLWHEIYQRLDEAARSNQAAIPKPPKPLILAGWWGSSDLSKQTRWRETIKWAEQWGFTDLIGDLPDERMHKVDSAKLLLPLLAINPYPNRNYTPRQRPSPAKEADALAVLQSKWGTIAGSLAEHTRPVKFTGLKRRRLVVLADQTVKPPWGDWNDISEPFAISFTKFRRAINDVISPHEVDHVDFVH